MTAHKTAACPQCRQPAVLNPENRFRPFCSERCKLLDLGQWMSGRYGIPVAETDAGADPDIGDEGDGASDAQFRDRLQ